ncbi:hypothetical protein WMF45_47530 [Sorangium sp. So ce448]|uniref:hypothetical protein n=1 Tax=Sorangium sp. So ce448 TaxID=3133314 RepID=UPI003F5E03C5
MSVAPEALLGAGYAVLLLGIAAGIRACGGASAEPEPGWPHDDARRFHLGLSLVVLLVGDCIVGAVALRNHGLADLGILGLAAALVTTALARGLGAFARGGRRA